MLERDSVAALVTSAVQELLEGRRLIPVRWLSPSEAAEYLGLKMKTLETHRRNKTGPMFFRAGSRAVRYKPEDLDDWLTPGLEP